MSLVGLPTPCPTPVKFLSAECAGHRLCPWPAEGAIAMLSPFRAHSPCWPRCTGRSSAACHSCPHTPWARSSRCSRGRPGLQGAQHKMKWRSGVGGGTTWQVALPVTPSSSPLGTAGSSPLFLFGMPLATIVRSAFHNI